MFYIHLIENSVLEIIPDEVPAFPGIPATQRYAPDFISRCITADDVSAIHTGMIYDPESKTFSEPPVPEPVTIIPDLSALRTAKLAELDAAAQADITGGCDVTLADGTAGHISLTAEDQINLSTARDAVQNGASGYPYHLDRQLCKFYSKADIQLISDAATTHILYHTTLCNHLLNWVRRATTLDELESITYDATLPNDLKANMETIISAAST